MSKRVHMALEVLLIAVLVVFDQFTKKLAVEKLMNQPAYVLINGVLELDYLENRGVAFGMFQGQRILIFAVGIVFLAFLLFIKFKMPIGKKFTVLHIILSCIAAGGIGNMIDRVSLGYVIDFISFVLIDFPIFNVADCYVVCGVIAMCIMLLFVFEEDDLDFLSFKKTKES